MTKNPFVLVGDIPEPYFCDRVKESEQIIRSITNGVNICLVSPRRMGKSKLVKHCYRQEALKDFYCFYIDILHTASARDLAFTFGRCVFEALQTRSEKLATDFLRAIRSLSATFSVNPITGAPAFSLSLGEHIDIEYTFENIFQYLEKADMPCIVCFDEFQQVANYPEKNTEALLRSHIQHLSNANFIFSGSERHMLYEMFSNHNRPFYNSTRYLELRAITEEAYRFFAQSWFSQYNKTVDDEMMHIIYTLSEGNTYTLQKICHELFASLPDGGNADREMLASVLDNIIEEATPLYERQLSHIPERQQQLLFAIAKEGSVEKIMSGEFIRKHKLSSASSVQNAVKRLIEMDLISYENKYYSVGDIFFRLYLQKIG